MIFVSILLIHITLTLTQNTSAFSFARFFTSYLLRDFFQDTIYSHLKVSLLQDSFVQEVWNSIGKQTYLETLHPLVISNLYVAPNKSSAAAASVLLIGSSEELGVPITINQVKPILKF